jgi:hypothetical protein
VVVERTLRHPCRLEDLGDRRRVVAVLAERLTPGLDQPVAGRLALLDPLVGHGHRLGRPTVWYFAGPLVGFFERVYPHDHEYVEAHLGRRRIDRRLRGTGPGPPLLLLHGWPMSSFLYREITPVLATEHRVVVPDLPGFGASSKPVDREYSFALFATVLDALVERLGLEDLGLVVHDLGGPIGVHWALHRPRSGVSPRSAEHAAAIRISTRPSSSSSRG